MTSPFELALADANADLIDAVTEALEQRKAAIDIARASFVDPQSKDDACMGFRFPNRNVEAIQKATRAMLKEHEARANETQEAA